MSEKEKLVEDLLKIKLHVDNRGNIYHPDYQNHLSLTGGCWQHPDELADFLIFLKEHSISTFLNIGTFNGITFNVISNFLNVKQYTKCITIDIINHNPIRNREYEYLKKTSKDFKGQCFDLVFIDGDHSYNGVKDDYDNVGQYAKICVFHDIYDDFVIKDPGCHGGVPKFWQEIKTNKKTIEFNSAKKIGNIMGIGVIIN